MLLQARDYLWLHDNHGCELQIGGSDQWGNIVQGVDLIRRVRGTAVHALSWPLLLAPDGAKLGKTTGARVWLDPAQTSPYRFYQHWIQTDDRQVREFLLKFTLLATDEIDAVVAEHEGAPERRLAQRRLALEVTALVHGAEAAEAAEGASAILFGSSVREAPAEVLETLAGEVPTTAVGTARLAGGIDVIDLLLDTGLAASKSNARRLIAQGGVSVNDVRVADGRVIGSDELLHGRYLLLRRGKSTYHLVEAAADR
jgi:tyrosyl-tRNA synthetase